MRHSSNLVSVGLQNAKTPAGFKRRARLSTSFMTDMLRVREISAIFAFAIVVDADRNHA